MEVIVPAAGFSTRYPGDRPKYLRYDYKNQLMLRNAVEQFIGRTNITIGILDEHDKKFSASSHIYNAIPNCNIVILDKPTKGPADTVYQILNKMDQSGSDFSFLVKDCDSFFIHDIPDNNYVCVSNIKNHETLKKLSSKSFVKYNDQNIVLDIVEKQVVSDTFCVGGYKFNSSSLYIKSFESIRETGEVYISHVIQNLLNHGETFITNVVRNYIDVGTGSDWEEYNNKPVIFCDIDGTLIKSQSRFGDYTYSHDPVVLEENYQRIKEYYDRGSQLIFVSAREPQYYDETNTMLKKLGFENVQLIMGLNNSQRILINDYNDANPYPRAVAYNIKRDHDNLKDYMR